MTDNVRKLLEMASADEALKEKLTNASKEEIIAIAEEAGIVLEEADFEIGDDELRAVSGGTGSDEPVAFNGNPVACISGSSGLSNCPGFCG